MNKFFLLVSLLGLLTFSAGAQTTYTFNTAGGWSNPANWSGGVVPPNPLPAGDAIVIAANCSHTWYLTINGSFTVNAGVTFTYSNAGEELELILNGTGSNYGTIDGTAEDLVIGATGVFTNYSGASVLLTNVLGGISNSGQYTNQASATTNTWGCGNSGIFTNNGSVILGFIWTNLAGSTLNNAGNFTGSSSTGALNNAAGATINFSGGLIQLSCGITNTGTINLSGGEMRLFRSPLSWPSGFTWTGGTVTVGASLTIGSGLSVTVPAGATLTRMNGNPISIANGGSIVVNGVFTPQSGSLTVQSGGNLSINAGGTTTLTSATLANYGTINNAGTLNVSASTGQLVNFAGSILQNSGTINLTRLLRNGGDLNNSGIININSSGTLEVNANPGVLPGGTINWNSGGYISVGSTGVLELNANFTVPSGRNFTISNGGQMIIPAGIQFTNNGTITASGTITNNGTLSNSNGIEMFNTLTNNGTLTQTAGALTFNYANAVYPTLNGTFNWNGGVVRLGAAGSMTLNHAVTIPSGMDFKILGGTLNNASTLTNNGIFSSTSGGTLNNNATLINNGTISNLITFNNNNLLKGSGGLNQGAFTNPAGSTFAPGLSPGCYTIQSSFTNNGTLEIEIDGTTACSNFDRVTVLGTANRGGTLSLIFGFTPSVGQSFQVMTGVSFTGSFSNIIVQPNNIAVTENNGIITVNGILPVELLDFSVNRLGVDILIQWQTASENNNKGFTLERSTDARQFHSIGWVAGKGQSLSRQFYDFTDSDLPDAQTLYYRLRQEDFDGQVTYSKIIAVQIARLQSARIAPNPFRSDSRIYLDLETESAFSYQILDAQGKLLYQSVLTDLPQGASIIDLPALRLSAGIYFVHLGTESGVQQLRFVVE
jgi:hypothetical protein